MIPAKKPQTHRAFCILGERWGRRVVGRWVEAGSATVADDGNGLRVYVQMLPVTGFDGNILLRPVDAKPDAPPLPEPEDEEEYDDGVNAPSGSVQ